jgi:hypothetical protein
MSPDPTNVSDRRPIRRRMIPVLAGAAILVPALIGLAGSASATASTLGPQPPTCAFHGQTPVNPHVVKQLPTGGGIAFVGKGLSTSPHTPVFRPENCVFRIPQ